MFCLLEWSFIPFSAVPWSPVFLLVRKPDYLARSLGLQTSNVKYTVCVTKIDYASNEKLKGIFVYPCFFKSGYKYISAIEK